MTALDTPTSPCDIQVPLAPYQHMLGSMVQLADVGLYECPAGATTIRNGQFRSCHTPQLAICNISLAIVEAEGRLGIWG